MTQFYKSIQWLSHRRQMRYIIAACFCAIITMPFLTLGQATSQTLNASGTYVVPSGYTAIVKVDAWGAGGGASYQMGGGGGAYAGIDNLTLTAGSYAVMVGTGETGSTSKAQQRLPTSRIITCNWEPAM